MPPDTEELARTLGILADLTNRLSKSIEKLLYMKQAHELILSRLEVQHAKLRREFDDHIQLSQINHNPHV